MPLFLQSSPIIVKIIELDRDPTGIGDVLIKALGITGVLAAGAILFGLAMGGMLYWMRSGRGLDH